MGLVAYLDDGRAAARPRRSTRRTLRLEVAATAGSGSAAMVIHDLSPTGLLIETDEALAVGQKLSVELPEVGKFPAEAVWSSGRFVGCRFDETLPQAAISAALLRSDRPGVRPEAASPAPVQELQARVQRQLAYTGGEKAAAEAVGEPLAEYDRLPLHVRGRIMVGLAAGSGAIWAVLLWGVGVI
ncbi:PilZ domain-containing protein [uncultured Sphingomonas sp.]|uniref:PilZ domain-containing protein n=1 Tax=uncultured Sphingomonas sp. TaxID=158754 RepID=UPI0025CD3915|nr:PilZ domain-containing protein [uncultured Sphingomonas sp.]